MKQKRIILPYFLSCVSCHVTFISNMLKREYLCVYYSNDKILPRYWKYFMSCQGVRGLLCKEEEEKWENNVKIRTFFNSKRKKLHFLLVVTFTGWMSSFKGRTNQLLVKNYVPFISSSFVCVRIMWNLCFFFYDCLFVQWEFNRTDPE